MDLNGMARDGSCSKRQVYIVAGLSGVWVAWKLRIEASSNGLFWPPSLELHNVCDGDKTTTCLPKYTYKQTARAMMAPSRCSFEPISCIVARALPYSFTHTAHPSPAFSQHDCCAQVRLQRAHLRFVGSAGGQESID